MTAAASTTTTVASITGVGRSMTESLQHSETSSADCYLIWPCILIFSYFMYLNFQFQFGRLFQKGIFHFSSIKNERFCEANTKWLIQKTTNTLIKKQCK